MQNLGRKLFGFLLGLVGIIFGSIVAFVLMPVIISLLGLSPQGASNNTPIPVILTAYALSFGMGIGIIPGIFMAGYHFLPITFLRYISVIPATFGVLYSGFTLVFNLPAPWLWFGLVIGGFVIIYPLMRPNKNRKPKQQSPQYGSRLEREPCRSCKRTGQVKCSCDNGRIYRSVWNDGIFENVADTCPNCYGRSTVVCRECGGAGYV